MDDFKKKTDATILGIIYHPELFGISEDTKKDIAEMVRTLTGSFKKPGSSTVTPEQKHELEKIIDEQIELMNVEKIAGNIVKEEFHKGALFGIRLILECLKLEVPRCNSFLVG